MGSARNVRLIKKAVKKDRQTFYRTTLHRHARCCMTLPFHTGLCTLLEPAQEPEKRKRRKSLTKRILATVARRVWEQEVAGSNPVAPIL